jgi:hypothetical protein
MRHITLALALATVAGCAATSTDDASSTDTSMHGDGAIADANVDAYVLDVGPTDAPIATLDAPTGDAGDAFVSTDAWMPTTTCGNAVIDPGEVCDPGVRMTPPDGGPPFVAPINLAYCPACTAVVCPAGTAGITDTGTPADNRCVTFTAAAPRSSDYPGWVARVLSWGSRAERDAYISAFRTLGPTTIGHVAAHRSAVSPITSCSSCGSMSMCSSTATPSICATSGTTGRCVAWYWDHGSGPYGGMPVADMPPNSGACPSLASMYVYLTITATNVTSSQDTSAGPGYLVVLDPPGSAP